MDYTTIQAQLDKSWRVFDPQRVAFLREVLAWVDQLDRTYRVIQIAGTNGKGSTGAILREILRASGASVGHFASPAVYEDREQIWLNGEFVAPEIWVQAYEKLLAALTEHDLTADALSYFETWTLVALMVFEMAEVDYAIVEAGLGGLHDATNIIAAPAVVAFTEIGLDHLAILGNSLAEIARNKAGLMKENALIVSDLAQESVVKDVLQAQAKQVGAQWFERDVQVAIQSSTLRGLTVEIDAVTYVSALKGRFQARNLAVVWQILAALESRFEVDFTVENRRSGLARARMIGRLQVDDRRRLVWDGAHNLDAAQALVQALADWRLPLKPILILGILADKDYQAMLTELLPHFARVIAVTPANPRALLAADLVTAIKTLAPEMSVEQVAADQALNAAQQIRRDGQFIVIAGSFYTLRAVGGQK
ncbi:MAG TPA: Mur ligase family protein [Lactobacillaceae bacterium]|jgi:dihydrofolate synthase/folylpolyglutamate synthase